MVKYNTKFVSAQNIFSKARIQANSTILLWASNHFELWKDSFINTGNTRAVFFSLYQKYIHPRSNRFTDLQIKKTKNNVWQRPAAWLTSVTRRTTASWSQTCFYVHFMSNQPNNRVQIKQTSQEFSHNNVNLLTHSHCIPQVTEASEKPKLYHFWGYLEMCWGILSS